MIDKLKQDYKKKKSEIKLRLNQFKEFYSKHLVWNYKNNEMTLLHSNKDHNHRLFEELSFCILTANTSAEMGMIAIDTIRHLLSNSTKEEMTKHLIGKYRFINLRPAYITHTRSYLKNNFNFKLKEKLESFKDKQELRDFIAINKGIKGISFKEASHFLRNIGYKNYAILDKHIINSLHELKVLETNNKPKNRQEYLEIELKLENFSKQTNIGMDELDLLLWSNKTGRILK